MNDKTQSKVDTNVEAEELKGDALKDEELEDKDLDQVTGGYIKITLKDIKSDDNGILGVSRRKASSLWEAGDWSADG